MFNNSIKPAAKVKEFFLRQFNIVERHQKNDKNAQKLMYITNDYFLFCNKTSVSSPAK